MIWGKHSTVGQDSKMWPCGGTATGTTGTAPHQRLEKPGNTWAATWPNTPQLLLWIEARQRTSMLLSSEDKALDDIAKAVSLLSIPTFLVLRFGIVAPYGKHSTRTASASRYFGPSINAKLAWIIFESPNLVWVLWSLFHRVNESFGVTNAALLLMFTTHYINRSLIYPLQISGSSRPVPLAVAVSGFSYCFVNGYLQGQTLCRGIAYPDDHLRSARFVVGAILFLAGFAINLHSDRILRQLCDERRRDKTTDYSIPKGGVFELVSCANYAGEILEWLGYAVACNNHAALSFFLFTCSNLIPRGLAHHEWYLQKFEDYPQRRKAVIPFLL